MSFARDDDMRGWRFVIPVAALSVLASCGSDAPERSVPEAFYQSTLSIGIAQQIATTCDTLETSTEARDALLEETRVQLTAEGISGEDLAGISAALPKDRLRNDIAAFASRNSLDIDQPQTFCTAGQGEIEADSMIGKLLKKA